MTELRRVTASYEFQKPPEGYTVSIDWVFGSDLFTKSLGQKLHFSVSDGDIELPTLIAKRDPKGLSKISGIWGRTALCASDCPETIFNHSYDTLELGGFGNQGFVPANDAVLLIDFTSPIKLPTTENFAVQYPSVTHTSVVDEGKEASLGDNFSFTGAYTPKQIARKFAANLFVLNRLANLPDPPFLVPIPLAIGHYPTIVNEMGEYAYFGIFKVPYRGKRTGNRHIIGNDKEGIYGYAQDLMDVMPAIAPVLAYLSNIWGLTHNQPHPGNVYIPHEREGRLALLADFSTIYPLKPRKHELARARELRRGIESVWKIIQTIFQHPDEDKIIGILLRETLMKYVGCEVSQSVVPTKAILVELFLSQVFEQVKKTDIFPKTWPTDESWQKILSLERTLLKEMRKNK